MSANEFDTDVEMCTCGHSAYFHGEQDQCWADGCRCLLFSEDYDWKPEEPKREPLDPNAVVAPLFEVTP